MPKSHLSVVQLTSGEKRLTETAARWLAGVREGLLSATRGRLKEKLQIGSSEFESIIRLISSRLDVPLSGLWDGDDA